MARMKPTALSLFSGIGGFCEGVKLAGFRIVGAVEKDKYAAENYRLNFPDIPLFEGDVANFLPTKEKNTWEEHFKVYVGTNKLDLLFGGPPCQGYSQIGPRDPGDPRNELYLEVCRIAEILRPKFILLENVPNMIQMKNGMFRNRIVQALQKIGYDNIFICLLKAEDFGVPQKRRRVFILATDSSRLSENLQVFFDGAISSLKCKSVSVNQAIGDLPRLVAPDSGIVLDYPRASHLTTPFQKEMRLDSHGIIYSSASKLSHYKFASQQEKILLHNHHTKEIQDRRLNLIKLLKPGKKADSLPKEVWNNARPEKWRRLDGGEPAYTLLAQMHRDLSEWVHPRHHRWITVREALRLQSFHDGFILRTSEWQQLKQVGNAVPPLLAKVAATAVAYALMFEESNALPSEVSTQLCLFDLATSSA